MENILEKYSEDLLKSDLSPEDLLVCERKKIRQIMKCISKNHNVGDFLLKNGCSVLDVPLDVSQIEGIWLTKNCVASLNVPEKKLTFYDAKKFCLEQRILGIPLCIPSDVYVSKFVQKRLLRIGWKIFKDDFYWSALQFSGVCKDMYAVINPFFLWKNYFFVEQKAWCYAVLELPD